MPPTPEIDREFISLQHQWRKWDTARWRHVFAPRKNHQHSLSAIGQQLMRVRERTAELQFWYGEAWADSLQLPYDPATGN